MKQPKIRIPLCSRIRPRAQLLVLEQKRVVGTLQLGTGWRAVRLFGRLLCRGLHGAVCVLPTLGHGADAVEVAWGQMALVTLHARCTRNTTGLIDPQHLYERRAMKLQRALELCLGHAADNLHRRRLLPPRTVA